MGANDHFQNALSNFTHEVASGGAIRHLTDLGYTARQIAGKLDFPTPFARVQREMWERLADTEVILLEEPGGRKKEKAAYVREQDQYGRISFRRVVEAQAEEKPVQWRERRLEIKDRREISSLLKEKLSQNGEAGAYASCEFGLTAYQNPREFQEQLEALDQGLREYVEGLPWKLQRVYHRLDTRMMSILAQLYERKLYRGVCYFMGTGEKLYLD